MQLIDRKRSKDLMLMLGLNEAIDKLAMGNSVCWHGNVFEEGGWSCLEKGIRV